MNNSQLSFANYISAIVLAICISGAAQAQNTDTYLTKYITALNARMPPAGDPATVVDLWTADGVQENILGKTERIQRGTAQLRDFFGGFKEFFSDWTHVETGRTIQGMRAVWEGEAMGHHKETGKPLRFPIVFVYEFDSQGKVRSNRVYFDEHAMDEQLK